MRIDQLARDTHNHVLECGDEEPNVIYKWDREYNVVTEVRFDASHTASLTGLNRITSAIAPTFDGLKAQAWDALDVVQVGQYILYRARAFVTIGPNHRIHYTESYTERYQGDQRNISLAKWAVLRELNDMLEEYLPYVGTPHLTVKIHILFFLVPPAPPDSVICVPYPV